MPPSLCHPASIPPDAFGQTDQVSRRPIRVAETMRLGVRHWWGLLARGIVAVLFGVSTLVWPGLTILALVILFGAYVIADGIVDLVAVFSRDPAVEEHRAWFTVLGIVAIGAGIVTFVWPGITALALLYIIAAWAIVTGAIEVVTAFRMRHQVRHGWLLGLAGVVSITFGIALAITPGPGALVITWLIGWYAVVLGIILIVMAFQVRGSGPAGFDGDVALA